MIFKVIKFFLHQIYKDILIPVLRVITRPLQFYCKFIINVNRIISIENIPFDKNSGLVNYKLLHVPEKINRKVILNKSELHWKFKAGSPGLTYYSEPVFVAEFNDAKVVGDNGAVLIKSNSLISDVSREIGNTIQQHTLLHSLIIKNPLILFGKSIVISAPDASNNYFHWMFDVLPRIKWALEYGIKMQDINYWIVNSLQHPFQRETLNHVGIKDANIINMQIAKHVICKDLILPARSGLSGNVSLRVVNSLKFFFSDWVSKNKQQKSKRIFISRNNASKRRLLNYNEIIPILDKYNIEVVSLEKLSVREQVQLFSKCDTIIGVHGAGFTNIVFCQPSTQVIEIFNPNYVNQCYWTIASHNNLKYNYFLGEGDIITDNQNHLIDFDILLNTKQFDNFMCDQMSVILNETT